MKKTIKKTMKNAVAYVYYFVFGIVGKKTVHEVEHTHDDVSELIIVSINGFTLRFYCKRFNFVIRNHHGLIPDLHFSIYRVYADNSDDAPEKLKEALKHDIYLPSFRTIFMDEEKRRKFLIEAYIDVITKRIT